MVELRLLANTGLPPVRKPFTQLVDNLFILNELPTETGFLGANQSEEQIVDCAIERTSVDRPDAVSFGSSMADVAAAVKVVKAKWHSAKVCCDWLGSEKEKKFDCESSSTADVCRNTFDCIRRFRPFVYLLVVLLYSEITC